MSSMRPDPHPDLGDVPTDEEDLAGADTERRLNTSPEEQVNRPDQDEGDLDV